MNHKWLKFLINVIVSIIILSIAVLCLICMFQCLTSFGENQKVFNKAYTEATTTIVNYINSCGDSVNYPNNIELDNLSNVLTYLESLQTIQKNSTTNDIMSFIYSILSTILVGLCASFVGKSKKHADEAEKVALRAQENANAAKTSKEEAQRIRDETQKNATSAEMLKVEAIKQTNIHTNNIKIISIHIEIMYARYYLDAYDQVEANRTIYEIYNRVSSLTGTLDKSSVRQLRDELLILKSTVDKFNCSIDNRICNNNQKTSMKHSASRYIRQIKHSILICDNIIHAQTN